MEAQPDGPGRQLIPAARSESAHPRDPHGPQAPFGTNPARLCDPDSGNAFDHFACCTSSDHAWVPQEIVRAAPLPDCLKA